MGPGCDKTEPDKYYPSGTRNYARVVANDGYQGAADAEFAQSIGVKNVYILNDKEAYGLGVATNFQNAAKSLGIKIAGFAAFDPKASSYEALFKKIQATGADAVFIGGLICENGAQLIKDKVAVLGPERRRRQAAHAGRVRNCSRRSTTRARLLPACTCRSPASRSTSSRARLRTFADGLLEAST